MALSKTFKRVQWYHNVTDLAIKDEPEFVYRLRCKWARRSNYERVWSFIDRDQGIFATDRDGDQIENVIWNIVGLIFIGVEVRER